MLEKYLCSTFVQALVSLVVMLGKHSLVPTVKEQDQALCREADKMQSADFKVGGKKMRKFMCKILLYNIWCILIGRGRLE